MINFDFTPFIYLAFLALGLLAGAFISSVIWIFIPFAEWFLIAPVVCGIVGWICAWRIDN